MLESRELVLFSWVCGHQLPVTQCPFLQKREYFAVVPWNTGVQGKQGTEEMKCSLEAFKYFPLFMTGSSSLLYLENTRKLGYVFNKVDMRSISRHTGIFFFLK